jgi:hypothetical protein
LKFTSAPLLVVRDKDRHLSNRLLEYELAAWIKSRLINRSAQAMLTGQRVHKILSILVSLVRLSASRRNYPNFFNTGSIMGLMPAVHTRRVDQRKLPP